MKWLLVSILCFSVTAFAQVCPDGDEPPLVHGLGDDLQLVVCGYEDHDFPAEGNLRAFSEFAVHTAKGEDVGPKIYSSPEGLTQFIADTAKGFAMTEVWEVGDKMLPSLKRELTCVGSQCKVGPPTCVLKAPKNPYPKALSEVQLKLKKGKKNSVSEEEIDNVFAQAMGGDKEAAKFFTGSQPKLLDGGAAEAWQAAHNRIGQCK